MCKCKWIGRVQEVWIGGGAASGPLSETLLIVQPGWLSIYPNGDVDRANV